MQVECTFNLFIAKGFTLALFEKEPQFYFAIMKTSVNYGAKRWRKVAGKITLSCAKTQILFHRRNKTDFPRATGYTEIFCRSEKEKKRDRMIFQSI
jgi:hypothetical protein